MMDTVQKSLGTKQVLTTAAVKNSLASRFSLLSPWGMGTEAKAMPMHGGLSQCLMECQRDGYKFTTPAGAVGPCVRSND